jgi:pimeloyl-ACP methyl ester carboxylesterase
MLFLFHGISACLILVGVAFPNLAVASPSKATTSAPSKWTSCPTSLSTSPKLKCLTFKVPLDYDNPKGETIDLLAVKQLTANDSSRIGSLVFQQGGPGIPTAALLATHVNATGNTWGAAGQYFDIIAVDPRGVGINHPVLCDPAAMKFDSNSALFPKDESEFNASLAAWTRLGENCAKRTGKLINHLDTVTQAKDLEAARIAMGEGKLNYCQLLSSRISMPT